MFDAFSLTDLTLGQLLTADNDAVPFLTLSLSLRIQHQHKVDTRSQQRLVTSSA